jgi:hypothetical protein
MTPELQMQKDFQFPGPVERQGVTETTIGVYSLPKKARSNQYTRNLWSFRLKEGNNYAYFGQMYHDKYRYYHILSVEDTNFLDMLDYWDRVEEKGDRRVVDHVSFAQLNYKKKLDENGDDIDPLDKEEYLKWVYNADSAEGSRIPVKAANAIAHSIIKRLSPADRRVYQYMFEGNYTDAEIKQIFELEHSAWSNEKRRFLEKVRQIYIELGYDVPTLEEVKEERKRQEKAMKKIKEAREEDGVIDALVKSISREIRDSESVTKPRAFAADEQSKRDDASGLNQILYEEEGKSRDEDAEDY